MIIRAKKPFMNWMVKCLGKIQIIFIVFFLIGCTQNYSYNADPKEDLRLPRDKARKSGKNIIVQVGADWCPDTRQLDNKYSYSPLKETLESNYEVVRVWVSRNFDRNDNFLE